MSIVAILLVVLLVLTLIVEVAGHLPRAVWQTVATIALVILLLGVAIP